MGWVNNKGTNSVQKFKDGGKVSFKEKRAKIKKLRDGYRQDKKDGKKYEYSKGLLKDLKQNMKKEIKKVRKTGTTYDEDWQEYKDEILAKEKNKKDYKMQKKKNIGKTPKQF